MVILVSQNKITDFFMILAWVWAFNISGSAKGDNIHISSDMHV